MRPKRVFTPRDHGDDLRLLGHIARHGDGSWQGRRNTFGARKIQIGDHDRCALVCQTAADGRANTARPAGHDGHAVG